MRSSASLGALSKASTSSSTTTPIQTCPFVGEFFASLFNLYSSGHMCDVTVVVNEEHRFPAHRIVLSASSPFFRAMFTNMSVVESKSNVVHLNGNVVDPQSFKIILDYMYSRQLKLSEDTVCQVLQDACYLLMRDVEAKCCNFLSRSLSHRNITELLNIAGVLSSSCLTDLLLKYVSRQGLAILAKQREFYTIDYSILKQLLQNGFAGSITEDAVLDILLQWVEYDKKERASYLAELLRLIRVPLVQPNVLTAKITNEPLVRDNEACRKILEKGLETSSDATWPVEPRSKTIFCNAAVNFLSNYESSVNKWSSNVWAPYNINLTATTLFSLDEATLGIVGSDAKEGVSESDDLGLGSTVAAFDIRTGKWRTLPCLTTVRCRPAVVSVHYADLVFVAGGVSMWDELVVNRPISTCEVLHLSKPNWRPFVSLPWNGGDGLRLVSVEDRIFAIGGHGSEVSRRCSSNNVAYITVSQLLNESFDVSTEAGWSDSVPMRENRSYFGAAVLGDHIYAVGGWDETGVRKSVERYCPERMAWYEAPPLPNLAPVVTAVALGGLLCCLLSFQNDDRPGLAPYEMATFDPRENRWHYGTYVTPPCRIGISYPSMVVVSD